MRALLVYATAPRKAGIPNFSTAEMVSGRSRAALLPWDLQQGGLQAKLLLPQENAQQERLEVETVLCLLQEKQNSTKRVQKEAVLLVFSKPSAEWGEVYNAAEREGFVCFFLYKKITDLTFPICLSFVLLLKSESPKISSNQLLLRS